MSMATRTHDTSENTPQTDGNTLSTPLSRYIGLAVIGAIMMIMVALQSAGAHGLVQ